MHIWLCRYFQLHDVDADSVNHLLYHITFNTYTVVSVLFLLKTNSNGKESFFCFVVNHHYIFS